MEMYKMKCNSTGKIVCYSFSTSRQVMIAYRLKKHTANSKSADSGFSLVGVVEDESDPELKYEYIMPRDELIIKSILNLPPGKGNEIRYVYQDAILPDNRSCYYEKSLETGRSRIWPKNKYLNKIFFDVAERAFAKIEKKIEDASEAIQLNPEDASGYLSRAMAYGSLTSAIFGDNSNSRQSIADFTMAITLSPTCVAYIGRGFEYGKVTESQKAIADFEMAVQLNPDSEKARTYLQEALDGTLSYG